MVGRDRRGKCDNPKDKDANTFENHLNPVMLVFIG